MAKVMESLRINMMGDLMLPALAQVIRSKGRGPDTVLAHITPQEAEKLKKEGGSGSVNPDTGLPEFFNGSEYYTSYGGYEGPVYPDYSGGSTFDASTISSNYEPSYTYQPDFSARTYEAPMQTYTYEPSVTTRAETISEPPRVEEAIGPTGFGIKFTPRQEEIITQRQPVEQPEPAISEQGKRDREFMDKLKDYITDPEVLGKLGLAAVGAITGARTARKAAEQGRVARQEIEQRAQPYTARGEELISAAERGEFTPSSAKAYEAAQARLAQGVETRGGVGAQQAAVQLATLRQDLLQNQYDTGLRILGVGDNIAIGAIKTGLEADRYVNELTGNYFNNIARAVYGSAVTQPRGA